MVRRSRPASAMLATVALTFAALATTAPAHAENSYICDGLAVIYEDDGSNIDCDFSGSVLTLFPGTYTVTDNPSNPTHGTRLVADTSEGDVAVTLAGVNISPTGDGPAMLTTGGGAVVVTLEGENTLKSPSDHAGLQKQNGGLLTITAEEPADDGAAGSLTATGGTRGAGIGGGNQGDVSGIAVSGSANVTATGVYDGAGIGGGSQGTGSGITVSGSAQVTANSNGGAGIGGGYHGNGSSITVSGSAQVTATGTGGGAGIGGGDWGSGFGIRISGDDVEHPVTVLAAGSPAIAVGALVSAGGVSDAQVAVWENYDAGSDADPVLKGSAFSVASSQSLKIVTPVELPRECGGLEWEGEATCEESETVLRVPSSADGTTVWNKDAETSTGTRLVADTSEGDVAVTLAGVNIRPTSSGTAMLTTGANAVVVTLEGENTLESSFGFAGLQKQNGGLLTITAEEPADDSAAGSLTATGGNFGGAGIGGGTGRDGSSIRVSGSAQVSATGNGGGAGVGGGDWGSGSDIEVSGSAQVSATGNGGGAGVGGGWGGVGSDVRVSGVDVEHPVTVLAAGSPAIAGGAQVTAGDTGDLVVEVWKEYDEGSNALPDLRRSEYMVTGDEVSPLRVLTPALSERDCGDLAWTGIASCDDDGTVLTVLSSDDGTSVWNKDGVEVSGTRLVADTSEGDVAVTLAGVNISPTGGAAMLTTGGGAVVVTLEGENTLKSPTNYAGLQKENSGLLTITAGEPADDGAAGSLTATGGAFGAGIGGGYAGDGSGITVSGSANVSATGGEYGGAGIGGGGAGGSGSDIEVSGSANVSATGGGGGAGIGGGDWGSGSSITVSGSAVVSVTGGTSGAGIGGGRGGSGSGITVSGSAVVTATGGYGGAGIGGGSARGGSNIELSGSAVVSATGGAGGAGVGGGAGGSGSDVRVSGVDVEHPVTVLAAGSPAIAGDAQVTPGDTGGLVVEVWEGYDPEGGQVFPLLEDEFIVDGGEESPLRVVTPVAAHGLQFELGGGEFPPGSQTGFPSRFTASFPQIVIDAAPEYEGHRFVGWVSSLDEGADPAPVVTIGSGTTQDVTVTAVWEPVVTVPGVPTKVKVVPGDSKLDVSWVAPVETGGSAVTGYVVEYQVGGGQWVSVPPVGAVADGQGRSIVGLRNGVSYLVRVAAVNEVGTGAWSDVARGTPVGVPGVPTKVKIVPGNSKLDVSWAGPAETGGSPITGYEVSCVGPSGEQLVAVTGATLASIPGLTNGVAYSVSVRAVNAVGAGPWSEQVMGTPTKPGTGNNNGGDNNGGGDNGGGGSTGEKTTTTTTGSTGKGLAATGGMDLTWMLLAAAGLVTAGLTLRRKTTQTD